MFQFTHPGRGATAVRLSVIAFCSCFNSRTPGGVRRLSCVPFRSHTYVSIHAPREGCDSVRKVYAWIICCFNSRTPGGVRLSPAA